MRLFQYRLILICQSQTTSLAMKGLAISSNPMIIQLSGKTSVFATLDSHVEIAHIAFAGSQHHVHLNWIHQFIMRGPFRNMLPSQYPASYSYQTVFWKQMTQLSIPVRFALAQLLLLH